MAMSDGLTKEDMQEIIDKLPNDYFERDRPMFKHLEKIDAVPLFDTSEAGDEAP